MTTNTTLATFLRDLSVRAEAEGLDPRTLRLHVRRNDLAEHLDLTIDGLERAFGELSARGAVEVGPEDTVTILDRGTLELESGGVRVSGTAETDAVPPDQALAALRAILGDERFLSTPRTSALLVYLVERAIADGVAHLDVERIAVEVLGRPSGFDPADPTLRVLVTHLGRMLDEYAARAPDAAVAIRVKRGACRVTIEPRESRAKVRPVASPVRSPSSVDDPSP